MKYAIIFAVVPLTLALAGCDSSSQRVADAALPGSTPAVMLSIIASNPDGRLTYVGAFPDVPTGEVRVDDMLEFGDTYDYAFDGSVFVWEREKSAITRYEVSDNYQLFAGKTISFASYGVKFNADLSFVSPTRAFMTVADQNLVIVWDPSTMEVSGSIPQNLPPLPPGWTDTYPAPIGISGDNFYWAIITKNNDLNQLVAKNMVAVAPLDGNAPVTVIEDERCIPSLGGYVTADGDVYLVGGADADAIRAYNPAAKYPPACVVRIPAGSTRFDADFFVDLTQATGSVIAGTWRIDDQYVLARVWDPAVPLPSSSDDWWGGTSFISERIDFRSGETTPFPSLPRGGFSSNIQDRIDGATYLSLPNADGSADVAYRLKPDGIKEVFSIPGGGYWGMQRIR